jgi:hypothetical protein
MAQVVQPAPLVSLAYRARRALLAWAPLERQERWAYLVPPGLQELQALTVQQVPPASLEFLVLLELLVFQELLVRLVLRAVMVLQAQQVSSVSLVRLA